MKAIQRARKLVLLLTALTVSTVSADQLRLNVGLWPGELDPELEGRLLLDDLVEPTSRIDLAWSNKDTTTVYPLGLQYFKPMGPGQLVLTANYIRYAPEYSFNGISTG